ncbi:MAG: phenylalanine--tRNA ligase subunit beta [Candidatus Dormibacteria bacterium]
MPLRISMEWLREYIELPERAEDLADRLTLSGTEVEQVINLGAGWDGILVARVDEVTAIPGLDRVRRAVIDVGGRAVEVGSGASNLRAGDYLPWAPAGTTLPGGEVIGERKMRGFVSHGMLLSPVELGISAEADGLLVLGTDGTPGQPLNELMPPDQVMVIELTTNRPDLLCHLGIARELSALLKRPLRAQIHPLVESTEPSPLPVRIEASDLCARYQARWIGEVRVAPSPAWLQRRLRAVGQKPISNVVDAGNYVMFETGQPLHAFDAARLAGGIVVRRARRGEQISCLDGVARALDQQDLVIADEDSPVAIAGIIGGSASAVSAGTASVLVESASFTGTAVRNTSRRLALRTEASTRFEKQISPELTGPASARLAGLLQDLAGAGASSPAVDIYPQPLPRSVIRLRDGYVGGLLGVPIAQAEVRDELGSLGFEVAAAPDGLDVTSPSFRMDVRGAVDLVEEVGRLRGYNSLPSTLPGRRLAVDAILPPPDAEWLARDVATAAGYDEAITPSFASPDDPTIGDHRRDRLRLVNPMASDQAEMRSSLTWGLLKAVARNVAVGTPAVRLFELGRAFHPVAGRELPDEPRMLAAAVHLPAGRASSPQGTREALLALKGMLEAVSQAVSGLQLEAAQESVTGLHPGRTARLSIQGRAAGFLGQAHPDLVHRLDIAGALVVAELDFDLLAEHPRVIGYRAMSRFPAVPRDLAITVSQLTPARDVLEAISAAGEVILRSVELFDEYRGAQVPDEHKGLGFRLFFQSLERTLTGAEVASAEARIQQLLRERFAATVRE